MTKDEALEMAIDEIQDLMQHIKARQPDMLFTGSEYVINACKKALATNEESSVVQPTIKESLKDNPTNKQSLSVEHDYLYIAYKIKDDSWDFSRDKSLIECSPFHKLIGKIKFEVEND